MTNELKEKLLARQEEIMRERQRWEAMQLDWIHDTDFFHFSQWKMDRLSQEAEQIRETLEGGSSYER